MHRLRSGESDREGTNKRSKIISSGEKKERVSNGKTRDLESGTLRWNKMKAEVRKESIRDRKEREERIKKKIKLEQMLERTEVMMQGREAGHH